MLCFGWGRCGMYFGPKGTIFMLEPSSARTGFCNFAGGMGDVRGATAAWDRIALRAVRTSAPGSTSPCANCRFAWAAKRAADRAVSFGVERVGRGEEEE